ncbi:MAG: HlyD family secretion protein [Prevotellaceae bacterium]|jgi:HlyD family secretion protein|nr:HlyD family secretion protein [Prevotellaceae bacterium]
MVHTKEIELRSEEVQEVLGDVPHWILRWGIFIISVIVFILFAGSWFFKYPDTISATMTLTSAAPPASLVAKNTGRLKELYICDKCLIKTGAYLAVIENPASTEAMLTLKNNLQQLQRQPDSILFFQPDKELQLGNVQGLYSSFVRSLLDYQKFIELNYYPQKITTLQKRLDSYRQYYLGLQRKQEITEQQHQIAGYKYRRDSLLLQKEYLSQQELENSQTQHLQSRLTVENSHIEMENLQIRISELQEMILDNQQQYLDQKSRLESELNTNITLLTNEINTWEMNYVLVAPFEGQVTFTNYWTENQNITAGATIFSIISGKEENVMGKALLPVARSGKVKKGQKANIYLANYPDEEFGIVKGVVNDISLVPVNNHYTLEIALPDGLRTTYKKTLPFSQEMTANVEIITEDLRLLERIFLPVKKLLVNK